MTYPRILEEAGTPVLGRDLTGGEVALAVREGRVLRSAYSAASTSSREEHFYQRIPLGAQVALPHREWWLVFPRTIPRALLSDEPLWVEQNHQGWRTWPEAPRAAPAVEVPAEALAAVVARPDDDAPRLVVADQLTSRGEPRGEFIALQCRLASDAAEDPALRARAAALLAQHEARWLAELGLARRAVEWRRGFVERASASRGSGTAGLAHAARLTPLRGLEVLGTQVLRDVLASPLGRSLEELSLERCTLTPRELRALEKAPLRHLSLTGCDLKLPAARALIFAPFAKTLETLEVRGASPAALSALQKPGAFPRCVRPQLAA